ncbi:MAG: tRNA (guanine(10)-N(2))-dimethyltransferase [Candidatus Nanoarchaeia archaeon]|nr:tRNA (guanine(10)-N(2))-dimethyltransferase [Candidatus Nanoarchaeia archaeon]MDD5239745.1 tRNA (guanine(10)-N(2))-dimethyltransferase [Candidatus Nanoarchaeia archaeon]
MKLEKISEGKAALYVSKGAKISKELEVFYNPAKEFDRDLSVLLVKAAKKKTVLDLLAASGARGIRLAKEAGCKVTFNEVSKDAVKVLKKNLKINKLKSKVYNLDANRFLAQSYDKFDFIDIDPFGSPINFVFNSIKRLDKNGILAVTATDTAPLYGVYKYTCMKKYGSVPYHTKISHEFGLRILAKAVIELAAKWNVSLTPIFAHATQHYYRIYFQHRRSHADELMKQIGFIHFCEKCKARFSSGFNFQQSCGCGGKLQSAGPLYLGSLWNEELVKQMESEQIKVFGRTKYHNFLAVLMEESRINIPYYFEIMEFAKIEPRTDAVIKKLNEIGFLVSRTHFSDKGIRTNASISKLRELFDKA